MKLSTLENRLDEYAAYSAEISRLSLLRPDSDMAEACGRIRELGDRNRRILSEVLYPLIDQREHISRAYADALRDFCENITSDNFGSEIDLMLAFRISDKLVGEYAFLGDMDAVAIQINKHVMICYSVVNMISRMSGSEELAEKYMSEGLSAADIACEIVRDKKMFLELGDEARNKMLRTVRFYPALYDMSFGDKTTNTVRIEAYKSALELADDPWYRENVNDYDWTMHRVRCIEHMGQLTERGNRWGVTGSQCEEICGFIDSIKDDWESDAYVRELLPKSHYLLIKYRNYYYAGRMDGNAYREKLKLLYESFEGNAYDLYGVQENLLLPAEYLFSLAGTKPGAEEEDRIRRIYFSVSEYILKSADSDTLNLLKEYLIAFLDAFIEIPGVMTFYEMAVRSIAVLHTRTYVHSFMTAALTRNLANHLIRTSPGLFTGLCGTKNDEEVKQKKSEIMKLAYRCGLLHDFGKMIIIDTLTVYNRDLMKDEESIIKLHPVYAFLVLDRHGSTKDVARVALYHHVYYDKSGGYPVDLPPIPEGEKTLADMVAVADSIDAATDPTGVCFREVKSLEDILGELKKGAGSRYAPWVKDLADKEDFLCDVRWLIRNGRADAGLEGGRILKSVLENARGQRSGDKDADIVKIHALLEEEERYKRMAKIIRNDMETACPKAAMDSQGELAALLENSAFKIRNSDEYKNLLSRILLKYDELPEWDRAMAGHLRRNRLIEKNITPEAALEFSLIEKKAYLSWQDAVERSDYGIFEKDLSDVIKINREKCRLRELEPAERSRLHCDYDMLLDLFERGMSEDKLDPLFESCARRLSGIINNIGKSKKKIRTDFLSRPVPEYKQKMVSEYLMDVLGLDRTRGALAYSIHAYSEMMGKNDVRIVSYILPGSFISNIYSVIHETGHALFELLQPVENFDNHITGAKTLGMHESVSRFYENILGRSEAFIDLIFPKLKELMPEALHDVTAREFYEAVNLVVPSLIRTEADEVTYSMHIIIRYELEKRLFAGELSTEELPGAWNELYMKYLGICPKNDAEGVLQDVHWTSDFGYFPTYLLGNLYGAMYYEVMREDIDVEAAVRSGNIGVVNAWMKEKVFEKADRLSPDEWIRQITGRDISADSFIEYIEEKYSGIYDLGSVRTGTSRSFDGYVRRMIRIRQLSSPQLGLVNTADAYRLTLSENFRNIGELAGENRRLLKEVIDPILSSDELLSDSTVEQLKSLNANLMDAWAMDNVDLPVMAQLSERLKKDAMAKGDDDYLVRQLDEEIVACYALIVQTRRIITRPEITDSVRKRGVDALDRLLSYLDKDKYLKLSMESRELVMINSRYGIGMFHTMLPLSKAERRRRMKLLETSMSLADDPWYQKALPDYDWDYHRYRIHMYYSELDEYGNCAGNDEKELAVIADHGEKAEEIWLSDSKKYEKLDKYSNIHAHVMRNRLHAGRISGEEYRKLLLEVYEKRDASRYDVDSIVDNIEFPREYIAALDRDAMTEEQRNIVGGMYESVLSYIFDMPKLGVFYELLDYFASLIFNFIEIPGGMTFEEMSLKAFAAFHPPTYIHSMMVAAITRRLTIHLLSKKPELFVGMPGITTVAEAVKKAPEIEEYAYHAALCHDFGKLLIIDTIFVYGRKILDFEFDIIKQHPELGAVLMERYDSTREYADIARGHHIWYNKEGGYPSGFDLSASPYKTVTDIVACADCMDAATDVIGRSYRKGKSLEEFISELEEGAGTRYAPWLVELVRDEEVLSDLRFILTKGREENYRNAYILLKEVKERDSGLFIYDRL
ncbi:MAG: HD domain-containing protein [Lachnospiraceae bacterium]|nr:HD domain-containing protein [Lachnospiraceae bacterium]